MTEDEAMPTEAENLRQQLHLERVQRVEDDLERALLARDIPQDEVNRQLQLHKERIQATDAGKVEIHLHTGGVVEPTRGIPMLASHIYMNVARATASDPEAMAEAIRRKKASGDYSRF